MGAYFEEQGVDFPATENPAELMIEIVSGAKSNGRDWAKVWLESSHREKRMQELEELNHAPAEKPTEEDSYEFASPFFAQVSLVCERAFVQVCLVILTSLTSSFGVTRNTLSTNLHSTSVCSRVKTIADLQWSDYSLASGQFRSHMSLVFADS
jgi:hypothetical protein